MRADSKYAVRVLRGQAELDKGYGSHDLADRSRRVADLIESLSDPPITVDELQQRAIRRGFEAYQNALGLLEVKRGQCRIVFETEDMKEDLCAAWFSITAMTLGGEG